MSGSSRQNRGHADPQNLIEGHFIACLSDDQSAELEAMLLDDRTLRDDFRQAAALDSALRDTALKHASEPETLQQGSRSGRLTLLSRVTAVVVFLLTVSAIWLGVDRLRYPTIATLTHVSGDVTVRADTRLLRAYSGQRLWSGMEVEVSGRGSSAVIVWNDGSTMKLDANSRLNIAVLDAQKRATLSIGMVDCDINKQAPGKPLIVSTPRARLEVIGTRFRTRTTASHSTTEVLQGRVRVERMADSSAVTLSEREKVVIDERRNLEISDFYWSDRFRGPAAAPRRTASAVLQQTEGLEVEMKRINSRFKGAGETGRNL